ncbi:HTH-type transcriptional regulator VirS [Pseudovibrio axinellae]|uniref:HTH-type transcriptional regulator VirS n=1 Tax=Pseudovibrio axinellae TaxID=989403 RepID=A0A165ZSI7_9HYPH|nr:AraC family transcriptional regulator [Pseudovibrio axinellae]KZL20229.1 HTH-type transcriptional regulator VirS [Pseudovibrio axinellae]SEQ61868.1 AraC-type DNA-binding protein [Pseudovibrio axinellae]
MTRISANRLRHVARVYEQERQDALHFKLILQAVGVSADTLLDQNAKIDLQREAAALETACDALADPTFAARAGLAAPGAKTLLAYLAQASDTVGQVFRFAQRYYALEDPDLRFELDGDEQKPKICLVSDIISAHQFPRHREFLVFGLYRRTQQIAGADFGEMSVMLECDALTHCRKLGELAGCEVVGAYTSSGIQLPDGGFNFEIPTSDPALREHLVKHGDERLGQLPKNRQGISAKVIRLVRARLPGNLPSGDEVAKELCLTRRTLTRKLSEEGTNFKSLVEAARCDLAKRLLVGTDSIAQVAFLLDFADQAAFSVAFKRWTGATPAVFRKAKS